MYPANFTYHRASSVAEAVQLLGKFGDEAKVLAGGHSLLPVMKLRFATPTHLIDIGRIGGLSGMSEGGGMVSIGAMTRHADVAAASTKGVPRALSEAAASIGDVQVRNRGTIGGSIAHCDPQADYPAALLALGAQIVCAGSKGERVVGADQFFVDSFTTALGAGELVTQVRVPSGGAGSGSAYEKFADAASGYAVCGVAASLTVAGGKISAARVAMTGLASKAMRLSAVEGALTGQPATAASIAAAAAKGAEGMQLFGDVRGSAAYKAALAQTIVGRALTRALANAG